MKRLILAAAVLALAVVGVGRIRAAMASDEERLMRRLRTMVEGFESGTTAPVARGFHREYRDLSSGAGREDVVSGMQALVLTHMPWDLSVELPEESLLVTFDEDGMHAQVVANLLFQRITPEGRQPWWNTRAVADFVLEDGAWTCVATREVNHLTRRR